MYLLRVRVFLLHYNCANAKYRTHFWIKYNNGIQYILIRIGIGVAVGARNDQRKSIMLRDSDVCSVLDANERSRRRLWNFASISMWTTRRSMPSLVPRTRSWPLLHRAYFCENATQTDSSSVVATAATDVLHSATQPPESEKKRYFRTSKLLQRHYYPEGGWGWVIIFCATSIVILTHGLQLSFGGVQSYMVAAKYGVPATYTGWFPLLNYSWVLPSPNREVSHLNNWKYLPHTFSTLLTRSLHQFSCLLVHSLIKNRKDYITFPVPCCKFLALRVRVLFQLRVQVTCEVSLYSSLVYFLYDNIFQVPHFFPPKSSHILFHHSFKVFTILQIAFLLYIYAEILDFLWRWALDIFIA